MRCTGGIDIKFNTLASLQAERVGDWPTLQLYPVVCNHETHWVTSLFDRLSLSQFAERNLKLNAKVPI